MAGNMRPTHAQGETGAAVDASAYPARLLAQQQNAGVAADLADVKASEHCTEIRKTHSFLLTIVAFTRRLQPAPRDDTSTMAYWEVSRVIIVRVPVKPVGRASDNAAGKQKKAKGVNMISSGNRIAAVLVAACGVLYGAHAAVAAESGSFKALTTDIHDYTTLEQHGQTITGGPTHGTMTVIESSGDLFVEGESSAITCIVYSKSSDAGIDLEAPCTVTDSSGDTFFMLAVRKLGSIEVGGDGTWKLSAPSTGKYAGLSGDCTYTTNYLSDKRLVTFTNCEWQKQ